MKKQVILILSIFLILIINICGCNEISNTVNRENKKFLGTWEYSHITMVFFSDGTGEYGGDPTSWEIKDGKLVIDDHAMPSRTLYFYSFENNDTILKLTRQDFTIEWIKVE